MPTLRERVVAEVAVAPAWLRATAHVFVHGGFHTAMLEATAPEHGLERAHGVLARALYGEPTGRMQPDGYPERSLRWVDRIPAGHHGVLRPRPAQHRRSSLHPARVRPAASAVFLDTGAGKGGHLSWIDL